MSALFDKLPGSPMSEAQRRAIPEADLTACAHALAYETSTSLIESCTNLVGESLDREDWRELPGSDYPDYTAMVDEAVKYLDGRGLIERHPHMPNWIALRDESEAAR